MSLTDSDIRRFKSKYFVNESGCWIWIAAFNRKGYGEFWLNGTMKRAHRVSYEFHCGKIPDNLTIDHVCRIKNCVNPKHLEPVTIEENIRRRPSIKICEHGSGITQCINGCRKQYKKDWYAKNKKGKELNG